MGRIIDLTGMTFGKLKVLERTDDYISPKGVHTPQWLCECECGNQVVLKGIQLRNETVKSCGCIEREKLLNKHRMSQQEKEDWDELYQYVRSNVMGYDENQSLSKYMVIKLKGLLNNKSVANNKIENTANYSYQTVLNTFKFCMPNIQKALKTKSFKDENNKINYICAIVERNLNDVYIKMRNAKKIEEKIEYVNTDVFTYEGAKYKPKEKVKANNKFDNLW